MNSVAPATNPWGTPRWKPDRPEISVPTGTETVQSQLRNSYAALQIVFRDRRYRKRLSIPYQISIPYRKRNKSTQLIAVYSCSCNVIHHSRESRFGEMVRMISWLIRRQQMMFCCMLIESLNRKTFYELGNESHACHVLKSNGFNFWW